jgi:MFS family permease
VNEAKPPTSDSTPAEAATIDTATPLFRVRSFAILFTTRLASNSANQMQALAVAWQIYELTDSALNLGLIGLVQFLPPLVLMLLAGQVADRYNRRNILRICYAVEFLMSLGLLIVSLAPQPSVPLIYALLFVNACARTFEQPCVPSLIPVMVPRPILSRAIAAHVFAGRMSILLGPSLGGLLYVFGPAIPYGACALLVLTAAFAIFQLPNPPRPAEQPKISWDTLVAGFRFIWRCDAVLGAMLLDLLATLFGGVSALLPIFARDILDIGPVGAGILRSAPAVGALMSGAYLARMPIRQRAGTLIFAGFALYGGGTIVFGFSENAVLSFFALMVTGVGDMVSAVIRQTIVQVTTPDEMRGRVFAVNSLFVGTSGQLGSFQTGLMAALLGAVPAVVLGGCAVFATIALLAWRFPALRRVDRPDVAQSY